jgi:hypothetical protein
MILQSYDLIGDIHGQYDKLEALLRRLDYKPGRLTGHKKSDVCYLPSTWSHPEGRKVIFLGDYIDRGPRVRDVLRTVRGMVDAGDALAIMGNHEYNAVCYYTPDGQGGWLRPRTERNRNQTVATRSFFEKTRLGFSEWPGWLQWMKRLPMFLDLGAIRCVHACWDATGIQQIAGKTLENEEFLRQSATKMTPEHSVIENVLKGPEWPATEGNMFRDKEGTYRDTVRTRWWGLREGLTIGDLAMPPGAMDDPMVVDPLLLQGVPHYRADEPPVFCGHYWMPPDAPKAPLAHNIACLDFSAGLNGPLVAYRWDGEQILKGDKFAHAV